MFEAADGKAGVDLFEARAPEIDLIFLDMTLPGMSGGEVLSQVRRMQSGVKVIITSAYGQDHVRALIGEQHPWLFLRKPYRIGELTKLLLAASVWTRGSPRGVCFRAAVRIRLSHLLPMA